LTERLRARNASHAARNLPCKRPYDQLAAIAEDGGDAIGLSGIACGQIEADNLTL